MVYAGLFPEMMSIHGLSDNSRLAWTANTERIMSDGWLEFFRLFGWLFWGIVFGCIFLRGNDSTAGKK